MTSIGTSSGAMYALSGLREAEQTQLLALKAIGSGSLDPNVMAQAAAILQGAQSQEGANAAVLKANLRQQSMFIDMLV